VDAGDARSIGARARMIRRHRGLSLEVVAGLAGITAGYLSLLERGQRGFNRRGLIEDLADALGCSVADLTGQPYPAPDRATKDAAVTLPSIRWAGFWTKACPVLIVCAERIHSGRAWSAWTDGDHCGGHHAVPARVGTGRLQVQRHNRPVAP
jgi:transcriptional regulator with XRE-family HTH domain